MTETELLEEVEHLCRQFKLYWHHCGDSRRCQGQAGLPDLLILGPGGIILAELKDAWNDTSAAQEQWRGAIFHWMSESSVRWVLWRPADFDSRRIHEQLHDLRWPRRRSAQTVKTSSSRL
jgi:hypothetical protein